MANVLRRISWRTAAWLSAVAALSTALALLTAAIAGGPTPSQDEAILRAVSSWDWPGIGPFFAVINVLTNNYPGLALGVVSVVFLWLLGLDRAAVGLTIIGVIIGVSALGGEKLVEEIAGRTRPFDPGSEDSFPSGHVFGSTVLFGFWAFLTVYYQVPAKIRIAFIGSMAFMVVAVGLGRIYAQEHWPSDVVAAYLLGAIWLLLLVPLFLFAQRLELPRRFQRPDLAVLACETCRLERSIASVVVLDPQQGTATKAYRPPPFVKLLYWVAFQARFPYESNTLALQVAVRRRRIASLLTTHVLGRDAVAPATAVTCEHGKCTLVTEYVPGGPAENDDDAKRFLGRVSEAFASAGLSVWQINPRNPHAHTNLIRRPDGEYTIVDLESALVTPFPARGQWRSSLKRGSLPVFDDIDFARLRTYVETNRVQLFDSLGPARMRALDDAIEHGERDLAAWHGSEPRVWGRLIRGIYRLFNWKAAWEHLSHALAAADDVGRQYLERGIARWEAERRISSETAAALRGRLGSGEAQDAVRHLGAHVVLSVALPIPIPGLRSAARVVWTAYFLVWTYAARVLRRNDSRPRGPVVHTPLVMLIAVLPVVGAVAYLASPPLRQRLLVRLAFDQAFFDMPFGLYRRLHLARWLAPTPGRDTLSHSADPGEISPDEPAGEQDAEQIVSTRRG